ncbi:MAG: RNA 2',3'-cyclic phosphodiesterase [Candidatus Freyarchaeota archaeon]
MEKVRSFIAVDVDSPQVLDAIKKVQEDLSPLVKAKFVELENVHFTLKFLGEISSEMVDKVYEVMKTIPFEPFRLELCGVGCFPSIRRVNVIWIGARKGSENLKSIADELERKLKPLGFKPESRPFTPHATIARVKFVHNREKLASLLSRMKGLELGEIAIDSVKLKRSQLTPKGPVYTTLRSIP